MAEIKLAKSSSDHSDAAEGITRRELLKTGGKVAAAAAVSSVFSPFFIQSARATTKTLSFWQFYAPNGISNLQSKWFVDCVAAWNATHDVKVELQYVPNNDT
jgi:multiple sugar transport system substrate-binding protein